MRKTVGELVYYTVGYMQMTEEQVLVSSTLSELVLSSSSFYASSVVSNITSLLNDLAICLNFCQVQTWSSDPNQYVADEDDVTYSCRVSGWNHMLNLASPQLHERLCVFFASFYCSPDYAPISYISSQTESLYLNKVFAFL